MGRKYTTEAYYDKVQLLKKYFPDCSVTTDLIVGFPSETEEEFAQTLAFLREKCAFSAVHVFPFSVREKTRAARMDGQLPKAVKAERAARAKKAAAALTEKYLGRFVGKTLEVLPEHCVGGRWMSHGPIWLSDLYRRGGDLQEYAGSRRGAGAVSGRTAGKNF